MENIYREYWMQLIFLYVLLLHQNCCDVQNLKKKLLVNGGENCKKCYSFRFFEYFYFYLGSFKFAEVKPSKVCFSKCCTWHR